MDDIIGEALRESCGIDILDLIQTPQLDSSINIILDPLYRHFRTAKEIESDGHGNYINGKIELNPPPRPGEVGTLTHEAAHGRAWSYINAHAHRNSSYRQITLNAIV